jgi:hypothetical protein
VERLIDPWHADNWLSASIGTSDYIMESAKKSGVGISQVEIRLRPYPSSDSSCELFYAAYARR